MSNFKSTLGMLSVLAAMASMDSPGVSRNYLHESKESKSERERRLAKSEIERNKRNGLAEFFYGENSLWALNQKSADKKATKLGYT
jgi:hypothetical protein